MEVDTEPEPNIQISDNESNEPETIEKSDDDLFNTETLVAENDLVKVYIIKDYFKRQKIFKYYIFKFLLNLTFCHDLYTHGLVVVKQFSVKIYIRVAIVAR